MDRLLTKSLALTTFACTLALLGGRALFRRMQGELAVVV